MQMESQLRWVSRVAPVIDDYEDARRHDVVHWAADGGILRPEENLLPDGTGEARLGVHVWRRLLRQRPGQGRVDGTDDVRAVRLPLYLHFASGRERGQHV